MTGLRNGAASQRPTDPYSDMEAARYMIHHVFLPPQLPQQDDFTPELDDALVDLVIKSLEEFQSLQGNPCIIDSIISMARNFQTVHNEDGYITHKKLEEAFAKLSEDEDRVIMLHVRAQNAGILIHRDFDGAIFEVFELSPDNRSVNSTKGRLQRSFPAFAVSISLKDLGDNELRTTLSQAVSKMSAERVEEMQPKVKKAGEMQNEIHDTVIPHLVTEHLVNFLRAIGKPVSTTTTTKNTREEVLWKGAKNPWRRSSLWLLFRVAMQLTFSRLSADPLKSMYKPFMAFLMSRVLKLALTHTCLEGDIIYAMNTKLFQRLLKIEGRREELWFSQVWGIMKMAQSRVDSCWKLVMANSCPSIDLSALRALKPSENIIHELPHLDLFLRQLQDLSKSKNHGQFKPRGNFPTFDPDRLPRFARLELDSPHRFFGLTALESWVELHLETWLDRHINVERSCVELGDLIQCYHQEAKAAYEGNPEALSIMVLTIMDLWIACDKTACRLYESLKLYDHEISPSLLWSLLLPLKSQLIRISKIELYFKLRADRVDKTFVSPFRNFGHRSSFAVRYFDQSPQHQHLLAEIERKADMEKAEKVQELARLNSSHRNLMDLYESRCCEYVAVTRYNIYGLPYEDTQHSSYCMKCSYREQANALKILLHEWPVSRVLNTAKATIFELAVPPDFGAWRDITHYMIRDVLAYKYREKRAMNSDYTLQRDPGIKTFFRTNIERVGIRSHTKPSTVTHRNPISIPTTQELVCLANGLSYQYFDFKTECLIDSFVATNELHTQCVFALSTRSKPLQRFLQRTPDEPNGPEPNEVIASLSECPDGMSLDEFRSFALVPLGYEIQWQNILSQLAVPALDFTQVDTTFLLLQVSQQIGPNNNSVCRPSHQVLADESFSISLLEQLRAAIQRVGDNWESFQAPAGFICLVARLLASTPFPRILSDCLGYLASCRYLLFGWVTKLRAKTQSCINSDQRDEFAARTVEIALTCISSFGVDREHLKSILCVEFDASIFIQCSITIQEHLSSIDLSRLSFSSILLTRWRRLMYDAYHDLVHQIVELSNSCLNLAIKEFWADYKPGLAWKQLPTPKQLWLYSSTASDDGIDSFSVHFNLLTAELLVNGAPLAKLPMEYENNAMYPILFGRSHMQVMPSNQPGFQFSSRCQYAGHLVHFGMLEDDMLLHTIKDDCKYSLIPSRVLSGHLPQAFVDRYVHWLDHQLQDVFCVPIETPWSRNSHYWRLSKNGLGWIIGKGKKSLVNMKSRTAQAIGRILHPLEDILFVHISYHTGSGTVDIELPRLRLGFFLKPGDDSILSNQYQDMFIDGSQDFGTLFGLTSKLVLKSTSGSRRVLIPERQISYQRRSGHVSVSIQRGISKVHSYGIDTQLGQLVGSGSMQNMLLLCYLHGLTSYCLPDPLTRVTGTEQALTIITSAAVRSFDILDRDNLSTLRLIAQLAPKRLFYPSHLQEMQTVQWDPNLSFMSQHSQLYLEVRDMFSQAMRSKPLYPNFVDPPSLDGTRLHLLERDLIRSSTTRVSGFGAEKYTDVHDVCYKARDRGQRSDRALRTFTVARSIFKKEPCLHNQALTYLDGHLWRQLSMQEPIPGPQTKLKETETLYGGHLLGNTAEYMASKWCQGHVSLSHGHWENKYRLMMWLSTTAFAKDADMLLIETFIAFYCIPSMARIAPPNNIQSFFVRKGSEVNDLAASIIFHALEACPESQLAPFVKESAANTRKRRRRAHREKQEVQEDLFVRMLEVQWPRENPTTPHADEVNVYIKVEPSMVSVRERWTMWWNNLQFRNYLNDIESALRVQSYRILDTSFIDFTHRKIHDRTRKRHIQKQDLFEQPPPMIPYRSIDNLSWLARRSIEEEHTSAPVESLLAALKDRVSARHEQQYLSDLQDSIAHLNRDFQTHELVCSNVETIDRLLQHHRDDCKRQVQCLFDGLIQMSNQRFEVATSILHAPRTPQRFYLEQLSHTRWQSLSDDWKQYFVRYAKAFRALQRAERLIRTSTSPIELISELVNVGDQGWDPMIFPEWLLLEVESGLLLREVQASIAKNMLNPELGRNSVMQLNMGEGKSTFIVPAVAAAAANGQNLVRVFVARPQSKQMFQMLVSKLGGLVGRQVYHMPISRSLRLRVPEAESLWAMCIECMKSGGILLVQPEHVLSFKLMAIESLLNGDESLGRSLLKNQHFFETESRDIIDESDENFSVKFELTYTMGLQQAIELSPDRWIIIQCILRLVAQIAPSIALALGTQAIEVEDRHGRFPRTRLLHPEAGKRLRIEIAKHICEFGLAGFPVAHQSNEMRRDIIHYITEPLLKPDEIAKIENSSSTIWTDSTKGPLLLIRGLLAGGVLEFALSLKRWRVNYGVDPLRLPPTKLAVPFRAKDCPSPRSEFSHPDVVIMLTSLSYYYEGLSNEDLFDTFQLLLRADQPGDEYRTWTKSAPDLPKGFRHLSSINLKDRLQCVDEIFPALRFSKGAIDYFLRHVVFRKYIKGFPHKISASGWDLGQEKSKPTTGFSGTIDSRHLLPLDVHHLDLNRQKHTNALVLKHILQPENSVYALSSGSCSFQDGNQISNATILLRTIRSMQPPVRVIIDVGAQILECNNRQVVEKWLSMWEDTDKIEAGVFFNENDEISVVDRKGHVELLQESSYGNRLHVCLVFLDEAHTRGTDLKLPVGYRAAVTVGPRLTKDRLVQACMRMRKLGKGQSLVFCIPYEIQAKILQINGIGDVSSIEVMHVLCWSIFETFLDLRRSIPLWAVQGHRFMNQQQVWGTAHRDDHIALSKDMAENFLEVESQSLDYRYRPRINQGERSYLALQDKCDPRILGRCREFNVSSSETAALEEEQERELSPEIEEEREVERPPPAKALKHSVHKDLRSLVTTGRMIKHSSAWLPAFQSLHNTTAAEWLHTSQFPSNLLVTVDFSETVQHTGQKFVSDSFLRPVQWILTCSDSKEGMKMIVISPFEARKLLSDIRMYKKVTLHCYLPRPSLQFKALDSLDLFTEGGSFESSPIPEPLSIQLNLFAGQLYLSTFKEYIAMCDFLGLAWQPQEDGVEVASDGFIMKHNPSNFTQSPVKFLHVLLTKIRRDCDSIEKTHMGKILGGTLLERNEFIP